MQQQAAAGGRDGGEGSGRRRAEGTKLRDTLKYVVRLRLESPFPRY